MAEQHKYRMGEFSQRLGVSRDLIKHYEKQHILTSRREEGNQYRYYYHAQYPAILISKKLQNLGYSLREIGHILNGASLEEYAAENAKRIAALEREHMLQEMALEHLRFVYACQQQALERTLEGRWELLHRPALIFFPFSEMTAFFPLSPEDTEAVPDWVDATPAVEYCRLIRQGKVLFGFTATPDQVELLELRGSQVEQLPACQVFCYYLKVPRSVIGGPAYTDEDAITSMLPPVLAALDAQDLTATGPFLARHLFEAPVDGKFYYYCQVSVPVSESTSLSGGNKNF
ncbi:MAG: MerR family transcriptional regulator [Clostridiales bacterium]|nr:MerR family transcriptional regulator [Clostridiales bacterium]